MAVQKISQECKKVPEDGYAFFFSSFRNADSTDPHAIIRSILGQLMACRMSELSAMAEYLGRRKSQASSQLLVDELKNMIVTTSQLYKKTTIFIDAVDECSKKSRETLIRFMTDLPGISEGRIRVFISSRKEHDIEFIFNNLCNSKVIPLSLVEKRQDLLQDVSTYATNRLDTDSRFKRIPEDLKKEIVRRLTSKKTLLVPHEALRLDDLFTNGE